MEWDEIVNNLNLNIINYDEIEIGNNFKSFVIESDSKKYFLKGYNNISEVSKNNLEREIKINHIVNKNNILTPTMIQSDINKQYGYVLYEYIESNPISWHKKSCIEKTISDMALFLSKLHNVNNKEIPACHYGSGKDDFINNVCNNTINAISNTEYNNYITQVTTIENILHNYNFNKSFMHGDIHPPNVLVDSNGNVNAVIDWEYSGLGDALFDIAKFEVSFIEQHKNITPIDNSILIKKFRDTYNLNEKFIPKINLYKKLLIIRELGLVNKHGPLDYWSEERNNCESVCLDLLNII